MVEPLDILSPIDANRCKLVLHRYGKHRMGQKPLRYCHWPLPIIASLALGYRRFSETAPGYGDHS
jgi:hypothetical protein